MFENEIKSVINGVFCRKTCNNDKYFLLKNTIMGLIWKKEHENKCKTSLTYPWTLAQPAKNIEWLVNFPVKATYMVSMLPIYWLVNTFTWGSLSFGGLGSLVGGGTTKLSVNCDCVREEVCGWRGGGVRDEVRDCIFRDVLLWLSEFFPIWKQNLIINQ